MHVIFISCCEKKAIKRTRALLDSYAKRSGDRTWLTPITQEGLSELHKALRKTATRQTSVACFRNDGMKRMRLLWIVGNSKRFDKNGVSPIATIRRNTKTILPEWAKTCALIAETAGFMHDLGKFNQEFQHKLDKKDPIQDNVRHEWLSMFLAKSLIDGYHWLEAVELVVNNPKKFSDKDNREETLIFNSHLGSAMDALLYCVATHHKLPYKDKNSSVITNDHHVNFKKVGFENPTIPFSPSEKLLKLIQRNIKKLTERNLDIDDKVYWRAIATFSRMALILADQSISALYYPASPSSNEHTIAYANTHGKEHQKNQELSWHLENVGLKAGQMIFHMLNISLPKLSQGAIDQINKPSSGRYSWQNKAALALSNSRTKHDTPHLVLNIASTGSGKTRMNLRAICALNESKPVRVATALNLRTLTLQTSDAYQQQIKIGKDEIACVIGDSLTQKLHESKQANVDEDESEESIDVMSDFDFDMPSWLQFYAKKNPKLNDIIGAPLLVSTIDFLISAGEPHRKHHHILAAMRVMHSDLVLDEIDGYEPKALLAVLRLVLVAAMFGRNVIASSATLSKPVAEMLWRAYHHGAKMRGLLNKEKGTFYTALINDLTKPSIHSHSTPNEFMQHYEKHVQQMLRAIQNKPYRVPILAKIADKNEDEWLATIKKWATKLHKKHAWVDNVTNKRLSFGLIRIANIKTAIKVAEHLSSAISNAKIVCYHSNHFPMQRFHIEQRLDFLLERKGSKPNQHIIQDKEIRQILDTAKEDVQFIVIATPVEEIGRDHDFDWAIIEPSSSQSIVQAAGRVNRHRLVIVNTPNVAILQYCYKEIKPKTNNGCVFIWPGLETVKDGAQMNQYTTHLSHDLAELFDWSQLEQIDARMRFNSNIHLFAKYDDDAIKKQSEEIFKSILTEDHLWMAKETYTETSLRTSQEIVELYLADPNNAKRYHVSSTTDDIEEIENIHELTGPVPNDWLIKNDHELINDAENLGITDKKVMTVSISRYDKSKDQKPSAFVQERICRHQSFGFYVQAQSR